MSARLFTAQLKPGADPAETALVDDRWRWGAAAFPLLWALWSRHWVAAVVILIVMGVNARLALAGGAAAALAFDLGLRLAVGFEGGALARLDRRLRGWRLLGVVPARSLAEAEARWFGARAAPAARARRALWAPPVAGPWAGAGAERRA